MKWLMAFLVECYEAAPAHLNVQIPQGCGPLLVAYLEAEADELWSFVGKGEPAVAVVGLGCPQPPGPCLSRRRSQPEERTAIWDKLPVIYREHATFHTDAYAPYGRVIPQVQHRAITKEARKTNHVERFNGTLRQRLSRLVRSTLSFSKKLANHIGAIRYFLCHYNLTRATRCRGQSISG